MGKSNIGFLIVFVALITVVIATVLIVKMILNGRKLKQHLREDFVGKGNRWLTDNPMLIPNSNSAANITSFEVTRWPEILAKAPDIPKDLVREAMKDAPQNTNVMLLADPQDARASFKNRPQMLMPKGHFLALTSVMTGIEMDCGYQWVGKAIGYTCRSSLLFVLSVLHGHRISPNAVRLVNVPTKYWQKFELILGVIDVIVTFAIPDSSHMSLLIRQNINIMGFQRIQLERLRLTMPDVSLERVSLDEMVDGGIARVLARERQTLLPTLQLVAVVLHGPAPTLEGFENMYRCFGDDKIFTRTACESAYDVSGIRKPFRTVWDRKCVSDNDCPFNTRRRGGCDKNTGECEMPVGVRRLSYRKFETRPPFQPFCFNSDPWDLTGCKNKIFPDWAFPGSKKHIDLKPTANRALVQQLKDNSTSA